MRRRRQRPDEKAAALLNRAAKQGNLELVAALSAALETTRSSVKETALTILTNDAGHLIPDELIIGDYFIASRGSFDISSRVKIERKYKSILRRTYKKLTSRRYRSVFLIPTGPVTLNMQLKALVRDTLRIHTIDYAYFAGRYVPIAIDFRRDLYLR